MNSDTFDRGASRANASVENMSTEGLQKLGVTGVPSGVRNPSDPTFDAAQAIEIRQEIVLALISQGGYGDPSQIESCATRLADFVLYGKHKARAQMQALNLADALVHKIDQNMAIGQWALNLAEAHKLARQGAA